MKELKQLSNFKSVPQRNSLQIDLNIHNLDELIDPTSLDFVKSLKNLKDKVDTVKQSLKDENFNQFDQYYFLDFTLKDISSSIEALLNNKVKSDHVEMLKLGLMIGQFNGVISNIQSLYYSKNIMEKGKKTGVEKAKKTEAYLMLAKELYLLVNKKSFHSDRAKVSAIDSFIRKKLDSKLLINKQRAKGKIATKLGIKLSNGVTSKAVKDETAKIEEFLWKNIKDEELTQMYEAFYYIGDLPSLEEDKIFSNILCIARKVHSSNWFQKNQARVPLLMLSELILEKFSIYGGKYISKFKKLIYISNVYSHLSNEYSEFYSKITIPNKLEPYIKYKLEEVIFDAVRATPSTELYSNHGFYTS